VKYNSIPYTVVDSAEMRDLNLETSQKTLVLLKNANSLLPLDKSKIKSLGVIGPNADNRRALVGNYEGTASEYVTVLDGLRKYLGDDVRLHYSEGCHLYKQKVSGLSQPGDRFAEAVKTVELCDVTVLCLGLDAGLEGEEGDTGNEYGSGDKPNLRFPGLQEELLEKVCAVGKPVILLVLTGSAMDLSKAAEQAEAIVQCWYPGAQGGTAIARLLFGEFSPEGRLPVTFYASTEELPPFTDYAMEGRTYRYMRNNALYPFGYGLSYTAFEYGEPQAEKTNVGAGETLRLSVSVKNAGNYEAGETVQLYIKALDADANAPNWQLKGLAKVFAKPGQECQAGFELDAKDFGLYNDDGELVVGKGKYAVYLGGSQPDERSAELTGKEVKRVLCEYDGDGFRFAE
jgi:beta-glucosidase